MGTSNTSCYYSKCNVSRFLFKTFTPGTWIFLVFQRVPSSPQILFHLPFSVLVCLTQPASMQEKATVKAGYSRSLGGRWGALQPLRLTPDSDGDRTVTGAAVGAEGWRGPRRQGRRSVSLWQRQKDSQYHVPPTPLWKALGCPWVPWRDRKSVV